MAPPPCARITCYLVALTLAHVVAVTGQDTKTVSVSHLQVVSDELKFRTLFLPAMACLCYFLAVYKLRFAGQLPDNWAIFGHVVWEWKAKRTPKSVRCGLETRCAQGTPFGLPTTLQTDKIHAYS
ncbi:hypothetical protein N1851_013507 [Merluccius polli]|uniref:Uncharacterized protein n=1 Tax=Merluccius polli TaxID=89951 RepID=A0AA47P4B1_MERPO|nr:hypothetical protein N1851_013507 [Merluccius polli]